MFSRVILPVVVAALLGSAPAKAFDPNTFEALVIIEPDEEGFIFIGKKILRHIKPGWHEHIE